MGAVERAFQTFKNLIIANIEDNLCLTECVNRALHVMRYTIHTGQKITPFKLHHGRKPRTELTNLMKTGKSFLSNWSEMYISANSRPKIPLRYQKRRRGGIEPHCNGPYKNEKKTLAEKSPKKKNSVSNYPFRFFEKNHIKKHPKEDSKNIYKRQ